MSLFLNVATIAVATAVMFTQSHTAPIAAHLGLLSHPDYQGQFQQDSVPDPGIGDWFTNIYNSIVKVAVKALKDRNPKKIEIVKDYIKRMRAFVSPAAKFIQKYYPDDIAAHNILNAINTYLSSLDELAKEPSMSHEDMENLAKLMEMLKPVE